MKVRMTLDVDAHARYVIAKYYGSGLGAGTTARTRATRLQVRRFAAAAVRSAVLEQAEELDARGRGTARRLRTPPDEDAPAETLQPPREKQRSLPWN